MNSEDAISKARAFADTALAVEIEKHALQSQEKLADLRSRLAQRGIVMSGTNVAETAKVHSERLTALLQSRLNFLLEGFELHRVAIDDGIRDRVVAELKSLRSTWVQQADQAMKQDPVLRHGPVMPTHYLPLLEQHVGMRENEVRTEIDRRRFMQNKNERSTITVYHVEGDHNRVLTNSQDHSVNVVIESNEQIFTKLRQKIEATVPSGEVLSAILQRLTALEQAQNMPSFKERYAEFISTTADYVTLISPFIPALTEMLQKTF